MKFSEDSSTSKVRGVSQDEASLPPVWRADFGRAQSRPLRIEPEVGQSSKQSSKPIPGNEAADVLHEDEARSHVANDTKEVVDEVALVFASELLTCNGVRLARDAAKDEIHLSTPRCAVEDSQIREHRRAIQVPGFTLRCQDFAGEGFPLQVADRSSIWNRSSDSQVKATDAGADGYAVERIHT
ncbi:MAG: hypothetical protein OSB57_01900 [Planctomycetota bacterium]|nr:hypothetical protein [Planctomycetota bacterium]